MSYWEVQGFQVCQDPGADKMSLEICHSLLLSCSFLCWLHYTYLANPMR